MLFSHLFSLVLCLSVLESASIFDDGAEIESEIEISAGTLSVVLATQTHMFISCLNDELFHKVLEHVAYSHGIMAMTSKKMCALAERTKKFRIYGGDRWDMPELANVWKFGFHTPDSMAAEISLITSLKHVANQQLFIETLNNLLIKDRSFKGLTETILKYFLRALFTGRTPKIIIDDNFGMRVDLLIFAIDFGFYEIFFEMKTYLDPFFEYIFEGLIYFSLYCSYYHWVYDNPRALDYVLGRMGSLAEARNERDFKMRHAEIYAWTVVCFHRKAPEAFYVDYLKYHPSLFLTVIREYLFKYSFIIRGTDEIHYYHTFIKSLLDRYLRHIHHNRLALVELLNDIRYGPEDADICLNRIENLTERNEYSVISLIMAASKANKKELVQELVNNFEFEFESLKKIIDSKDPSSFKVLFDMIEGNPDRYFHDGATNSELLLVISENNFRIISAISVQNFVKFEVESASEYVELGFAPTCQFILENESFREWFVSVFKPNTFNDAANAGAEQFEKFITKKCEIRACSPIFIQDSHIDGISFNVIRLLLDNEPLIWMLRDQNVKLYCDDERISDELIAAKYRQVINPIQ